jgi:alkanesulfonate monooxygenase SsuD/methylene tetrahydromethanopterin reductase-like flavin-dependent oxidoreductase (luciferase family)
VTSLGMVVRPHVPPGRLLDIARVADEAGLEQLWLWEDSFYAGGIASAAAVLAVTERLRVGIGVMPVPYRNVALLAMEIAALDRMFPGRFLPGVGHGGQDWMGQAGVRVQSPMTLLREHVTALRALLRGERLTVSGRYVRLNDVALRWPPVSPPPVLVGATGPKSLRLSGEIADGSILDARYRSDEIAGVLAMIDDGHAGRDDPHETVAWLIASTGDGAGSRLAQERLAWKQEPDSGVGVAGDAADIAREIGEFGAAGVNSVVIVPVEDEPDLPGLARLIATGIQPLVR